MALHINVMFLYQRSAIIKCLEQLITKYVAK